MEKSKNPAFMGHFAIALSVILIIYPLLHEIGHALATWVFGGQVVQITVFPAFYTDCYIRKEQIVCYIMTAISGILFPLLCSLMIQTNKTRGFLMAFFLRIMSIGYAAWEIVSVCKCIMGSTSETSDLCVLVYKTRIDPYISLVLAGFLLIISLLVLVTMEPLIQFLQRINISRFQRSNASFCEMFKKTHTYTSSRTSSDT